MASPLVFPSTTSVDGYTRALYRPALAAECGFFATGSVNSLLAGLEADRAVIATAFRSDSAAPEKYDGLYLYVTSGDQRGVQRKLIAGGFEGPTGTFIVDYPFDDVLAAGATFEISDMPAEDYQGITGYNRCLNLGLDTLPITHIVSIDAVDQQIEYVLSGYPFPIWSVRCVYAPRDDATSYRQIVNGTGFNQNADQPTVVLPHSFVTGDTFEVELIRPAGSWIQQSGAWGDSSDGLTSDSDAALYSVRSVVVAAKPYALARMAQMYPRGSKERNQVEDEAAMARRSSAVLRAVSSIGQRRPQRVGAR